MEGNHYPLQAFNLHESFRLIVLTDLPLTCYLWKDLKQSGFFVTRIHLEVDI